MSESEYPEGIDPSSLPPDIREAVKKDHAENKEKNEEAKVIRRKVGNVAEPPGTANRQGGAHVKKDSNDGPPQKEDVKNQKPKSSARIREDDSNEKKEDDTKPPTWGPSSKYEIPDSDIFIDNKELQKITVYYRSGKSGGMKVIESISSIPEKERSSFSPLTFEVMRLNWALYTKLHADALVDAGLPTERIDWNLHKKQKLLGIIKKWDAKDRSGNPVKLEPEAIMRMHPMIGETLLRKYDRINLLGDDEQGK